jgi:hypothetical protein
VENVSLVKSSFNRIEPSRLAVVRMNGSNSLKTAFIDIAAALFVIGGVVSLVVSMVAAPIYSLYPFQLQFFSFLLAVVLIVAVICSLGAIYCFTYTSRRQLHEAGMRGIIFGAILLAFSLGLGANPGPNTGLGTASAILILIAGAVCFVLRDSVLPKPPMVMREQTAQRQSK